MNDSFMMKKWLVLGLGVLLWSGLTAGGQNSGDQRDPDGPWVNFDQLNEPAHVEIQVIEHSKGCRYALRYTAAKEKDDWKNMVSVYLERGQQIRWRCLYPFTVYFGAQSIYTDEGTCRCRSQHLLAYVRGVPQNGFYATNPVWVTTNTLSGAYKYVVAVSIPDGANEPVVCVDDPETIVPPPPK